MKLCLIADPIDTLHPEKDTSLALMAACAHEGHETYYADSRSVFYREGKVQGTVSSLAVQDSQVSLNAPHIRPLEEMDGLLLRKNPPFDAHYLYLSQLLDLVARPFLNSPAGLRHCHEKLSTLRFPEHTPPTCVSDNLAQLSAFCAKHGKIVLKPLNGMGGEGVQTLTWTGETEEEKEGKAKGKIKHNVEAQIAAQLTGAPVIVQRYLPEIAQGDRRIVLIDGEPYPHVLIRTPVPGGTGNLARGAIPSLDPLSASDWKLTHAVQPFVRQNNLFLVGMDVIGDKLTELNVTSPTGVRELSALSSEPVALQIMRRWFARVGF